MSVASTRQDRSPPDRVSGLTGIFLMMGAIALFSTLDANAKFLSSLGTLPVVQIIWMRFVSHTAINTLIQGPRRLPALARQAHVRWQILRGAFMAGATGFNFVAVSYLRLDQTGTIFFLTPLIVAALAGPLLGEWVGWRRMAAIVVGFSGVILVLRPGFGGVHWAIILSFGAMLSYAFYSLATRHVASLDSTEVTQFFTPLSGLIGFAPFALWQWQWPPDAMTWALLFALGGWGMLGHQLYIMAHRLAPASTLSPFGYTGLVWMIAYGYVLFGDVPDLWTLAGGAIVVGSGLYLLFRERQTAQARLPSASH